MTEAPPRLLIVGASGRTGRLLVERALERGHLVTAFVRAASRWAAPEGVRLVRGDVLDPSTLAAAMRDQDAIVSLLAPRPRINGRVYIEGTRNVADAAAAAGVARLIVVSAEGAGVAAERVPLGYRIVMRIPVVARLYPDIAQMDAELARRTDLDWTIVRPAILTNRPGTGEYRAVVGDVVRGGLDIPRADLAEFLLEVAERNLYVRQRVALAR